MLNIYGELVTGVLGAVKGHVSPENGDMNTTGPKCKWLPTALYAKIQIPCSRHAFFSPQVCKGQAVCRYLPTCPFPVTLICLHCPGACRDGEAVGWPPAPMGLGQPSCHSLFWHTSWESHCPLHSGPLIRFQSQKPSDCFPEHSGAAHSMASSCDTVLLWLF